MDSEPRTELGKRLATIRKRIVASGVSVPDPDDSPMLTTAELAAAVGVTPRRLLAIARRRGVKPARRVGRAALWDCPPAAVTPGVKGWPKGKPRRMKP